MQDMVRLKGDRDLHCSQVRRTRFLLRRDKEQVIRNLAEEVGGHFLVNAFVLPTKP